MILHFNILPTMIEAKNLAKLQELQDAYNESGKMPFKTSFLVLRSKQDDFMAYFHDANKQPTLKETVEWMEETDNLSFPGHVSLMQGIKARYDEKFHAELDVVIPEVLDAFVNRFDFIGKLQKEHPELVELLMKKAEEMEAAGIDIKPPSVKIK